MHFSEIDIEETHIRLTTDISNHDLKHFIYNLRFDLKAHINRNQDFLLSMEPIGKYDDNLSEIICRMYESSSHADVGPMACVAGTISELSLDYLIGNGSSYSIVENGGDIALVNDTKVLCGIYSNNQVLGNSIAFEIKPRKKQLGICTSSGKIGHSISFGSLTVSRSYPLHHHLQTVLQLALPMMFRVKPVKIRLQMPLKRLKIIGNFTVEF